jgi:hypothetical protein
MSFKDVKCRNSRKAWPWWVEIGPYRRARVGVVGSYRLPCKLHLTSKLESSAGWTEAAEGMLTTPALPFERQHTLSTQRIHCTQSLSSILQASQLSLSTGFDVYARNSFFLFVLNSAPSGNEQSTTTITKARNPAGSEHRILNLNHRR